MTKITNELLEDYAMLYPRIECVKISKLRNGNREDGLFIPFDYFLAKRDYPYEIEYIQLRSIDSITDEETRRFSDFYFLNKVINDEDNGCYGMSLKAAFIDYGYHQFEMLTIDDVDYFRSIGIATSFREITVDELVESGKLKLI